MHTATFLNNTAYADGAGLAKVKAASAVACCTKCAAAEASSGCFWFSFDQATGWCYLKADDRNPQARTGVTSGMTHHKEFAYVVMNSRLPQLNGTLW